MPSYVPSPALQSQGTNEYFIPFTRNDVDMRYLRPWQDEGHHHQDAGYCFQPPTFDVEAT
eukprot:scaffold6820_cov71-Cylindrotheca_fusiformis.AAC.1